MGFIALTVMEQSNVHEKNNEFYPNCTAYFDFLRQKGKSDYDFEDEYYFTMPAISSK